jgi:hypothetical protein
MNRDRFKSDRPLQTPKDLGALRSTFCFSCSEPQWAADFAGREEAARHRRRVHGGGTWLLVVTATGDNVPHKLTLQLR